LTGEELKALELLSEKKLAVESPFSLIENSHLWIKNKQGEMIRLIPNKAQRHILSIIKRLWNEDKIIRLFLLKARQLGVSTLIEAIIYAFTSQKENINTLIIADDIDGSNYLFEISKLFQEKCSEYLRPEEKKSNEKKLEFDKIHSQIFIDTAANKEAGRKYTFQIVHLSEYAYFRHPEVLMLGLSQTVPAMPKTMIIKETTANSFNFAKDEWDKAVNGEIDYTPIFLPWYWADEYRMPTPDDFLPGDKTLGEVTNDELILSEQMRKEDLDFIEERLMWRRWCIKNNCEGKVSNFQQEYPSTPEEAFIASGECVFDKERLRVELEANVKPIKRGNIVQLVNEFNFRDDPKGDFEFYEDIHTDEEYVVGGDASSGVGKDYACLVAIGKRSNNTVAVFRRKVDPDILAEKARLLGSYLNKAVVAIENDKYGFLANARLYQNYSNIFVQEVIDKVGGIEQKTKFGWETNSKTRPEMIGNLKADIRESATLLRDLRLVRECLTFVRDTETGKEEAQTGCNDDMVIARAIAGAVRRRHPYIEQNKKANAYAPIPIKFHSHFYGRRPRR
jgi:hypothetical protein